MESLTLILENSIIETSGKYAASIWGGYAALYGGDPCLLHIKASGIRTSFCNFHDTAASLRLQAH
jgi:hypothetical protein